MLMADTCSVVGCKAQKGQMVSLHILPNDQKLRSKWLQFIGNNCNVPAKLPSRTYVCSRHFPENCFENFIMTKLGFASKLILKPNAIPSIYSGDTASTNHRAEDAPVSFFFLCFISLPCQMQNNSASVIIDDVEVSCIQKTLFPRFCNVVCMMYITIMINYIPFSTDFL